MRDGALQDQVHFFGRLIVASYFAARGLGLVIEPGTMEALVREMPVAPLLAVANSAFLVTCAIFIALGIHTRFAALLLALYLFWSSYIFNFIGVRPPNLVAFWKDLALIGGLMMLVGHGRGIWAFDNLGASAAAAPVGEPGEDGGAAPEAAPVFMKASQGTAPENPAPEGAAPEAGGDMPPPSRPVAEPVFHHRAGPVTSGAGHREGRHEEGAPAGSFYVSGRGEFRAMPPLTEAGTASQKP